MIGLILIVCDCLRFVLMMYMIRIFIIRIVVILIIMVLILGLWKRMILSCIICIVVIKLSIKGVFFNLKNLKYILMIDIDNNMSYFWI